MNQERNQAYIKLTKTLLTCSPEQISATLDAHRELIDHGWLELIDQAIVAQTQIGNQNGVDKLLFLRNYVVQMISLLTTKSAASLWNKIWEELVANHGNAKGLSRLLQANLEQLNFSLAEAMKVWAVGHFFVQTPTNIFVNTAFMVNFSNFISRFTYGSKACNLEIAITGYEIALTYFTKDNFPQEWALTQNSLGSAYQNRILEEKVENIELAIACYNNALQVYNQEEFATEWAMVKSNLASAYSDRIQGDRSLNIEQAIEHYHTALTIYTFESTPTDWARTQSNLGVAYWYRILGNRSQNLEKAISCVRKTLRIYTRDTLPREWAEIQKNLGIIYSYRLKGNKDRNLTKSINYLTNSLQIYKEESYQEKWAETQNHLGVVYWQFSQNPNQINNIQRAINCFKNALKIYELSEFPEQWSYTNNNLAAAYINRHLGEKTYNLTNLTKCIFYCQEALKVQNLRLFPEAYAETLFNLGIAYQELNQLDQAYINFETAIDTIDFIRGEINSPLPINETKQKLATEWNGLYQRMIEVCLETHNYPKAIEYIERSKSRSLVELLANRNICPQGQISEEVQNQLQKLRIEIDTEKRYQRLNQNFYSTYINELRQKYHQLSAYKPINFEQIQNLINERTAIVQWYILDEYFCTFIIANNQDNQPTLFVWKSSSEDLKNLENWLKEYLQTYYNWRWLENAKKKEELYTQWVNSMKDRLQKLANYLHIDEIISQIPTNCHELIFIPYRYLHLLPLHALPIAPGYRYQHGNKQSENTVSDQYCLLDEFSSGVRYVPSCEFLKQIQSYKRSDFHRLLAIQNPTQDLRYADLEVEAIQSYFQEQDILKKDEAQKEAISNERLKYANCIHFSGHGYFNFENPLLSMLLLKDCHVEVSQIPKNANPERYIFLLNEKAISLDKCITLEDIFRYDLSECYLVTLSACETGVTDFSNLGDEYISLSVGFLYAGSSNVVNSLWEVQQLSTTLLMMKFYENLRNFNQHSTVAIALNQAQLWLRDSTNKVLYQWIKTKRNILDSDDFIKLRDLFRNDPNVQPYKSPYYWSAFSTIGK
ncbi:CHAT domain-containing protein [Anabaena sp. CCY 0017]|uniref:CHAT domain-containing protein n=1 Tax=Anabaena sp. CCY 0017 TaxID=3103866 RepID=UPI0039C74C33